VGQTTTTFNAEYLVVDADPGAGVDLELQRWLCEGAGSPTKVTVVDDLAAADDVVATVAGDVVTVAVAQVDGDQSFSFDVGGRRAARLP
jgi:hypothetical protein